VVARSSSEVREIKGEAMRVCRPAAPLILTHEEIAKVIWDFAREVTGLLSGFKKKGLIQWKGCNIVFADRAPLESSAAN
jgi:hypothetical protein